MSHGIYRGWKSFKAKLVMHLPEEGASTSSGHPSPQTCSWQHEPSRLYVVLALSLLIIWAKAVFRSSSAMHWAELTLSQPSWLTKGKANAKILICRFMMLCYAVFLLWGFFSSIFFWAFLEKNFDFSTSIMEEMGASTVLPCRLYAVRTCSVPSNYVRSCTF